MKEAQKKYKDTVFRLLYKDPARALNLYNGIMGTDYSDVEKVRNYAEIMPLEDAVEQAVDECIKDNVLREFLSGQKAEVVKMSIYEYDEEYLMN